jgi:hypothetical protein
MKTIVIAKQESVPAMCILNDEARPLYTAWRMMLHFATVCPHILYPVIVIAERN